MTLIWRKGILAGMTAVGEIPFRCVACRRLRGRAPWPGVFHKVVVRRVVVGLIGCPMERIDRPRLKEPYHAWAEDGRLVGKAGDFRAAVARLLARVL